MKQKTRKSAQKRFKVTGTGKVLHRISFSRQLRNHKSAAQKRRYRKLSALTAVRARKVKRMLALA
jgi:large subunit ribosomal protein L35